MSTGGIIPAVTAIYGIFKGEKDSSDAKKNRKADEFKTAEEKRKLAESTPFGAMDATKRVGAEREILRRSASTGRRGTIAQKNNKLG